MAMANMVKWVASQVRDYASLFVYLAFRLKPRIELPAFNFDLGTDCVGVEVKNLKGDMRDGRVFAALLHHFAPESIDYHNMVFTPENAEQNLETVFKAAEKLGIPKLLDGEDICQYPDDKSIYTYLQRWYTKWNESTSISSPALKQNSPATQTHSPHGMRASEQLRRQNAEQAAQQTSQVEEASLPTPQYGRQDAEKEFAKLRAELEIEKHEAKKEIENLKDKASEEGKKIKDAAKKEADEVMAKAEHKKEEILQQARKEAEEITAKAEKKRKQILDEAKAEADKLRRKDEEEEAKASPFWSSFVLSALLGAGVAGVFFYATRAKFMAPYLA